MPALSGSGGWIADAGYQGCEGISPIKKKPGVDRAESDREFNTVLAKLRAPERMGQCAPEELEDPGNSPPRRPHQARQHRRSGMWSANPERTGQRTPTLLRPSPLSSHFRNDFTESWAHAVIAPNQVRTTDTP